MNKSQDKPIIMWIVDLMIVGILLTADQFSKFLAIVHLKDQNPYVILDGVLEFQYLENRGSAFGMLQNQKFFILFVGFIFMAVLLFFLFRLPAKKKYHFLHVLISMVIAGGIGNMADRAALGYVRDFIEYTIVYTLFGQHFAICNLADVFLTFGVILLIVYLIIYSVEDSKKRKTLATPDSNENSKKDSDSAKVEGDSEEETAQGIRESDLSEEGAKEGEEFAPSEDGSKTSEESASFEVGAKGRDSRDDGTDLYR